MALTLSKLRTAIKDHGLGDRADLTDASVTDYLNTAQERLARVHDWRELRQTTDITLSASGSAASDKIIDLTSSLGASFRGIYNMVLEDDSASQKIEVLPPEQFDALIPLPEYFSRGRPTTAALWSSTELILHPVPDEAYTVRVRWWKWPTAFVNDNDTSDFDRKDDLLIHLTLSFILSLYRIEASATHFGIYQSLLREAIGEETRNPEVTVIRPNFLTGTSAKPNVEYWADPFYRG